MAFTVIYSFLDVILWALRNDAGSVLAKVVDSRGISAGGLYARSGQIRGSREAKKPQKGARKWTSGANLARPTQLGLNNPESVIYAISVILATI